MLRLHQELEIETATETEIVIEIDLLIVILMLREIRGLRLEVICIGIEIEIGRRRGSRGGRGVGVLNGMMLGGNGCRTGRGLFTGGSELYLLLGALLLHRPNSRKIDVVMQMARILN